MHDFLAGATYDLPFFEFASVFTAKVRLFASLATLCLCLLQSIGPLAPNCVHK